MIRPRFDGDELCDDATSILPLVPALSSISTPDSDLQILSELRCPHVATLNMGSAQASS